jgi:hypothetical protein
MPAELWHNVLNLAVSLSNAAKSLRLDTMDASTHALMPMMKTMQPSLPAAKFAADDTHVLSSHAA